jgi:hypothetical protein
MHERDDPEASYRRGYHQGAYDAATAAERLANVSAGWNKLRQWYAEKLFHWRYVERPGDRTLRPPPPPN